jgi:glucosamine--fructose-6-phosphate aminotransferase (isomerizing)
MCGIVGYVGEQPALSILLEGLNRLEYRGYDSAGVAFIENDQIVLYKKQGRLKELRQVLQQSGLLNDGERSQSIHIGIGHTRWATHGAPSDENSHPHMSTNGKIAVVHNGIIENYIELRTFLGSQGYCFRSETDTEVVAHLVDYHYEHDCPNDLLMAVRLTLAEIEGSYAFGVLCSDFPGQLVAARKDSPLIIGIGEHGHFIASDIPAILNETRRILIMEDREIARIDQHQVEIMDALGNSVERTPVDIQWDSQAAEKGGFEHFMIKEIHDEPQAVRNTISPHIRHGIIDLPEIKWDQKWVSEMKQIRVVACGTAYHAGMVGKHVIEQLCRIPVEVDIASEFRYRNPILDDQTLVIIISQSGETLDTLAAMREAKKRGGQILAVVNVVGSSIAREADQVLYTGAGPEIAVASSKAYNTQLAALYLIALHLASCRGVLPQQTLAMYLDALLKMPEHLASVLSAKDEIQRFASQHYNQKSIFFIGRGLDYALAMEASLKLKEISYIHSEAYAAGELKHGTIALVEKGVLVVCPVTQPELVDKTISNIREVKARGATVLGILTPACRRAADVCDTVFWLPDVCSLFAPIVSVTPTQLFAYYMSVNKGLDVDKPRNLAKSVTVE